MEDTMDYNAFYNSILDAYPDMNLGEVYKYKIKNKEFHLLESCNVPTIGYKTFITNGLRKFSMTQEKDLTQIKQELVLSVNNSTGIEPFNVIFAVLLNRMLIVNSKPYLRGEVIAYEGVIWDKYQFDSFVCYEPLYLEDKFIDAIYSDEIILVQLYPLFKEEREFIKLKGHKAFFDLVYNSDPDLMDLERESVIPVE